jgi:phosphohistidine phosphatase SixA
MDLYLIRHAEAGDRETWEGDDAERPLTDVGAEQAKLLATGLQQHGVKLDAVVTSPLVRTQQTATGLLGNWGEPTPELHTCPDLAPGGRCKKIARFVKDLKLAAVGLVGHMPDLEDLAGWLIGSRKVHIDLAKAGVALIRCPDGVGKGAGQLVWMITSDWLAEPVEANARSNARKR